MLRNRSEQTTGLDLDRRSQIVERLAPFPAIFTLGANFFLCGPPASTGQGFLEDPKHFWHQESAYASSEDCKGCHADIYSIQEASSHARSLRPANEVPELTSHLPVERTDRSSNSQLNLEMTGEGRLRLTARKGAAENSLFPEWAFGSGIKGITPVGRNEQGQFVESRLSWYEHLNGFDFTTGAKRHDPKTAEESLGRRLSENEIGDCFGCHTTGYDAQKRAPARNEMGVRCERCHGPGLEHVRAVQVGNLSDLRIFRPDRMDAFPQVQMCGACHGTPPEDNDFNFIRYVEMTPHTVRLPSQRLVLSRCFNETSGGLKCTTCHDPHQNVASQMSEFDPSCLSCHQAGAREDGSMCPVGVEKCSSCHMPRERVMRHSLFADHWIRVVRRRGY